MSAKFKARKSDSKTGELFLYGDIGDSFWGDGISAKMVVDEVNALGKIDRLMVRMNSAGGDVFDGLSIYNFLSRHPAHVEIDVDGMALSIASIIAMAGKEIRMANNAMMMIHDPWTMAVGSAQDLRKTADLMDQVKGNLINTYADRSGMNAVRVSELMSEETWLTAEQAVVEGFADKITGELQIAARFDARRFRNTPNGVGGAAPQQLGINLFRAKIAQMGERAKACGAVPL